jgi:hypothetical protein
MPPATPFCTRWSRRLPDAARYFVVHDSGEVESVAHCLMELWLTSMLGSDPPALEAAYRRAVAVLLKCDDHHQDAVHGDGGDVLNVLLRALRGDVERLDPDAALHLMDQMGISEAAIAWHYAELVVLQLHPHFAAADPKRYSDVFFGNYRAGTDNYGSDSIRPVVQRASETGNLAELVRAVVDMEGTPEVRGLAEVVRRSIRIWHAS